MAWVKILILAQDMSAGSGCYGALARRNNLNVFSVARYRRRASVSGNAWAQRRTRAGKAFAPQKAWQTSASDGV